METEGLFDESEFSKQCYKINKIQGRSIRLRKLI